MKRIFLTAVVLLTVCLASFASHIVAQGHSNTAYGDYKIETMDNHLLFMNKELDQYLITYEKNNLKVVVALDKQKRCKKYYVLSDQLPVQYQCNGTYFGIEKLDKGLHNKGFKTSLDDLNREEFYHQRVLVSEVTDTIEHLNLIAAYYPGLFKTEAVPVG